MTLWQFYQTPQGQTVCRQFVETKIMDGDVGATSFRHPLLAQTLQRGLYQAEPFYVSPEMGQIHQVAYPSFEVEPLLPTDVITHSGFVMFPEPLYLTDVHWKKTSWRGFAWWPCLAVEHHGEDAGWHVATESPGPEAGEIKPGIFIVVFSNIDDEDDYHSELRKIIEEAEWGWMPKLGMMHFTPWLYGEGAPESQRGRELYQQIQTFFRLTQQTITTREQVRLGRPVRRRAQRAKAPEKTVTVIRLRRARHKSETEGEGTKLTKRHIRHEHWRNQYYPSLGPCELPDGGKNPKSHRQIWINDMIVGPDEAPLVITERRAWELVQ